MTSPKPNESGKVSLEELLRLKRAERPAPEFWARFEQDLRAKQLAAIVEKRPWWVALRMPQVNRALAHWRLQLPLSAAAVLALSFVVVAQYRDHSGAPSVAQTKAPVKIATAPVSNGERREPSAAAVVQLDSGRAMASVVDESPLIQQGMEITRTTPTLPEGVVNTTILQPKRLATLGLSLADTAARETPSSSETVVELSTVAFDVGITTEAGTRIETRFETEGITPQWAQMRAAVSAKRSTPSSPREVRSKRILANMVVADNSTDVERSSSGDIHALLASTWSDESSYESARRIGVGGDRLILKF
jgi:hypothetical protein